MTKNKYTMEVKKNPKVDLERWRSILLEIGFIVSLLLIYLAFQYKDSGQSENVLGEMQDVQIEDEIIPITRQQEVKPPPPPPPPKVIEQIEIVKDDEEVDDIEIDDAESDEDTKVEAAPIVEDEEEEEAPMNFYVIEKKPEFPGGLVEMQKWIRDHTKYPEVAKENGITGKVYVQFVIGKDGAVTNVKVMRSVDPYLDAEALRVIKAMPKWSPGEQRGKPVKVLFQLPVNFVLY